MFACELCAIVLWTVMQVLIVPMAWLLLMLRLREAAFRDGRKSKVDEDFEEKDPKTRAVQLEYHNRSVYTLFKFFLTVSIAILGGLAVLLRENEKITRKNALILANAGGILLGVITCVFIIGICTHKYSCIKRWKNRFEWPWIYLWVEFWLIEGMLFVAIGVEAFLVRWLFN